MAHKQYNILQVHQSYVYTLGTFYVFVYPTQSKI